MPRKKFTYADLTDKEAEVFHAWDRHDFTRLGLTRAVQEVYGYDRETATQHASRLLRQAKFKDVMEEASLQNLDIMAPYAGRIMEEMLTQGTVHGQPVKPELVFKVAKEIHDRSHGTAVSRSKIEIEDVTERNPRQLRAEIADMLKALPEQDQKLLLSAAGVSGEVIDVHAEPVIVDPEAPWGYSVQTGEPKKKPGAPFKRRFPKPPPSVPPSENMTVIERRIASIKKKRADEVRKKLHEIDPDTDDE